MPDLDALTTAHRATHCGMCKVDYLGTGLCPAGLQHGFEAYWPSGRMELLRALDAGQLPPTRGLVDVVRSCTDCGACDLQCHFVTGLRPSRVQQELASRLADVDPTTLPAPAVDPVLQDLQDAVGPEWATADPAILTSYVRSAVPGPVPATGLYAVLPQTTDQVAAVVRLARRHGLPCLPRGAGTFLVLALHTLLGKAVSIPRGIILDLWRMKSLAVDAGARTATVAAGVTAFELQRAAHQHGLRAHVAETAAHVCTNLASFGIISTWMNRYGWGSDNFVDVEVVGPDGQVHRLSDPGVPNPYAAARGPASLTLTAPGIVTAVTVKLFERFDDETVVMLPFRELPEALAVARDLAQRGIGQSLAVLSRRYLSDFLSPSRACAQALERIAGGALGLNYVVDVVCRKHELPAIADRASVVLDAELLRALVLGAPRLAALEGSRLLRWVAGTAAPLRYLARGPGRQLLLRLLAPGPDTAAAVFDPDLQPRLRELFRREELSDPVWLHSFRILPTRMIRQRLFMVRGGFMKADPETVLTVVEQLRACAEQHGVDHSLGFIAFLENGKLAFTEYDYYHDHTDPAVRGRLDHAIGASLVAELAIPGVLPVEFVFHKGLARKEHLFYPLPSGLSAAELAQFGERMKALL